MKDFFQRQKLPSVEKMQSPNCGLGSSSCTVLKIKGLGAELTRPRLSITYIRPRIEKKTLRRMGVVSVLLGSRKEESWPEYQACTLVLSIGILFLAVENLHHVRCVELRKQLYEA